MMMMSLADASLAAEAALRRELANRLAAYVDLPDAVRFGVTVDELRSCLEGQRTAAQPLASWVITRFVRPVVPIVADAVGVPEAGFWHRRLSLASRELARAVRAVGRIELGGHPGLVWAGTCWLVTGEVAVTTRSVANQFCHLVGGRLTLGLRGEPPLKAAVRFGQPEPLAIKDVLTTDTGAFGADLAFLVLDRTVENRVALSDTPPDAAVHVAALGYAAANSRGGSVLSELAYRDSVNRKCVAPGRLRRCPAGSMLQHDCATAGDWAGALLLDLGTGRATAIHVTGALEGPGLGIPAAHIAAAMKALGLESGSAPAVPPSIDREYFEARQRTAADYADRHGYREDFLGIAVPPPQARPAIRDDVLEFEGAEGQSTTLLPYAHFSVCMSKSRRMCLFTACNVHGGKLMDLGRSGISWQFDPRIDRELQAGDELYSDNDLDRGHMVRRLDPVWGSEAEVANGDTFHFTNSCPQHKDLNQKTWNDLEDYVLDNAGKHELKLNVFTGPVLREDDPEYRHFRVPIEFWKVVVMVKDDGKLSATAYKLSQVDLLTGLEFAFGKFRTYQVRLRDVEEWTNLDWGELRDFDPKEFHESAAPVLIEEPQDIHL
jgi:endonuclease G, mitochondrial